MSSTYARYAPNAIPTVTKATMIQASATVACVLALCNAESTLAISTATLAKCASVVNPQSQARPFGIGLELSRLDCSRTLFAVAGTRRAVCLACRKLPIRGDSGPNQAGALWAMVSKGVITTAAGGGTGVRWRRTRLATVARPPVLGWTTQRPSRRTSARSAESRIDQDFQRSRSQRPGKAVFSVRASDGLCYRVGARSA